MSALCVFMFVLLGVFVADVVLLFAVFMLCCLGWLYLYNFVCCMCLCLCVLHVVSLLRLCVFVMFYLYVSCCGCVLFAFVLFCDFVYVVC